VRVEATAETWERTEPFMIANFRWTAITPVVATVSDGGAVGRGEGMPIFYRPEETAAGLAADILRAAAAGPLDRAALDGVLPANGARNALDCALWDFEAKRSGTPVWRLAALPEPRPLLTCQTIGVNPPERMAADAARLGPDFPLLKLKLGLGGAEDDRRRVEAVRRAAPDARLVVDANTGWTIDTLNALAPALADLGVEFIEQPLPPSRDADLAQYAGPLPLCADESCQGIESIAALRPHYAFINIKLDKTGGFTQALALARAGEAMGFRLMVGNMIGTSLAMAPAWHLGLLCEYADLDGTFGLVADRTPAIDCRGGFVQPPPRELWG
jgi:L-alanine-DL-glutamate epimerase-like enolase superfamily enzyme